MRHVISIAPWSYHKIVDGSKKVQIGLFDKKAQQIRINDIIAFENMVSKDKIECVVDGITIFEDFRTMINCLPPELFGYDNSEEVRVRVERLFSEDERKNNFAVGFFITPQFKDFQKIRESNYFRE